MGTIDGHIVAATVDKELLQGNSELLDSDRVLYYALDAVCTCVALHSNSIRELSRSNQ